MFSGLTEHDSVLCTEGPGCVCSDTAGRGPAVGTNPSRHPKGSGRTPSKLSSCPRGSCGKVYV